MSYQTQNTKNGTFAVIHTNLGDIKVKLFKDKAPKAVENFITHSKNGYYNNVVFHRVIKDFMIQGGDPTATGCGGESIWGSSFEDEFDKDLHNIYGALSMANSGPNTNGSQFFIVVANSIPEGLEEQMLELKHAFPEECIEDYKNLGGTPWLDYKHTVFGQVTEGMDTAVKISKADTDGSDKPLNDITILGIDIQEQ